MRLIPIPDGTEYTFVCYRCGKRTTNYRDVDARADLDGPAFRAYYCGECVRQMEGARGEAPKPEQR